MAEPLADYMGRKIDQSYIQGASPHELDRLSRQLFCPRTHQTLRLREAKKSARLAPTLPEKLERQRTARTLEAKREEAWRAYDQASREIDRQKDALLDEISRRLEQRLEQKPLFTLRWQLV